MQIAMGFATSYERCSLGFNVVTQFYNETAFLTAAHCTYNTAPWGGQVNGTVYQNVVNTSYQVGFVQLNPAWQWCDSLYCTQADAMMVGYNNPSLAVPVVATTSFLGANNYGGGINQTSAWRQVTSKVPYQWPGMSLEKLGRTTGWTVGTLQYTCVERLINDAFGPYVVACTDEMTGSSIGTGDSGGPVITPGSNDVYAVGIVVGGSPLSGPWGPDGSTYCDVYHLSGASTCTLVFSPIYAIENHLGRYFSF